jgi:hypothetical protein
MQQETIVPADEQFIGTVNAWELRGNNWPILGIFASHFVAEIELGRYMKRLLETGKWEEIRLIPERPTVEPRVRRLRASSARRVKNCDRPGLTGQRADIGAGLRPAHVVRRGRRITADRRVGLRGAAGEL